MTKYNVDNISIDDIVLSRFNNDKEFEDFFVNNLKKILDNSRLIRSETMGTMCRKSSKIREFVFDNFSDVLKKMPERSSFITNFMSRKEIFDHIQDFFVEDLTGFGVDFFDIINIINDVNYANNREPLDLIYEHIETIILYGKYGQFRELMEYIKYELEDIEKIKKYDQILAKYIDIIMKKSELQDIDFSYFDNMKLFKEEVKKKGIKFFMKCPVYGTLEEIKDISKDIIGKFDEETFAVMVAGYDEKNYIVLVEILKELIKRNGQISAEDIVELGSGCFAKAYLIGEYVLKIGDCRVCEKMPNHRRLLQPIIRTRIKTSGMNSFVEVQNIVDNQWYRKLKDEEKYQEINDILFKIYVEIREKGLYWKDVKPENVGKLKKVNKPNYTFIDIDGKIKDIRPTVIATGLIGEIDEDEILGIGDYVILDTDLISDSCTELRGLAGAFEAKYQQLIEQREENVR